MRGAIRFTSWRESGEAAYADGALARRCCQTTSTSFLISGVTAGVRPFSERDALIGCGRLSADLMT